jgi:hypothetical protein
MAFDIKMLKPATAFDTLGATEKGAINSKAVALRNIEIQLGLLDATTEGRRTFWDTVVDGKRSYTGKGTSVGFNVKVGSTKLMLGGTQEPGVAKAEFQATLKGIKVAIEAGQLDDQFADLDQARAARTDKMKATRAAKPRAPKA